MNLVLGIDPGISGGIAHLRLDDKGTVVKARAMVMPTKSGAKKGNDVDGAALKTLVEQWQLSGIALAAVESVHSFPGQGVASSFHFGMNFGRLLGVLEALGVSILMVTPQRWKKSVLDGLGREKSDAVRWVRNRFPDLPLFATERSRKPHDGMVEAVCLAEFARRMWLKGEARC